MVYVKYIDLNSQDGSEKKKIFETDQQAWDWVKKHDGKDIDFRGSNINNMKVKDANISGNFNPGDILVPRKHKQLSNIKIIEIDNNGDVTFIKDGKKEKASKNWINHFYTKDSFINWTKDAKEIFNGFGYQIIEQSPSKYEVLNGEGDVVFTAKTSFEAKKWAKEHKTSNKWNASGKWDWTKDSFAPPSQAELAKFEKALYNATFKVKSRQNYRGAFGPSIHYQVESIIKIPPKHVDPKNFDKNFMELAKRLDKVCSTMKAYETTFNCGVDNYGVVTAGIDVRSRYVKDSAIKVEKFSFSSYTPDKEKKFEARLNELKKDKRVKGLTVSSVTDPVDTNFVNKEIRYTVDAPYFDPMYKDTRRAIVKEAENYLRSKGLNNSVGKYDKAIYGVRSLLEKTLLQPGTDKFNDAVHREMDRLLRKYNLTNDREPLNVIAEKNGYGLAINEKGILVLKFPGESYSNPHMYLGKYNGPWDKNYKNALDMFEKFANGKKVNDAANGKLKYRCGYLPFYPPFKFKTMIIQASSKEEAKSLWEPGKKYGGYGKLMSIASYGHNVDKKTVDFEVNDAANGSVDDYLKKMANKTQAEVEKILRQAKGNPNAEEAYKRWKKTVKDSEMEKTYSYSIKIGGDLKKVRVKANNSDEALAKVKAEAIKFKADRVKTKWDNNKLSTRDQD